LFGLHRPLLRTPPTYPVSLYTGSFSLLSSPFPRCSLRTHHGKLSFPPSETPRIPPKRDPTAFLGCRCFSFLSRDCSSRSSAFLHLLPPVPLRLFSSGTSRPFPPSHPRQRRVIRLFGKPLPFTLNDFLQIPIFLLVLLSFFSSSF